MKIGIDAKWFFTGVISGRLFIQNLLPELFSLHPEIEWHVFLNAKDRSKTWPYIYPNVKVHYVWTGFNMLSNLFVLPRLARRLQIDAMLFQTFSSKSKSFKSIVFIHDILFKRYPEYFTWKERLYFTPLRWTAPVADRIVTTTRFVQKELVSFNYAKNHEQMDIAPSGVMGVFKPLRFHQEALQKKIKAKFRLPDSYLLFVGRLNARKNIENLVASFDFIHDKNICLVIAGEKDGKAAQLDHLIHEEGVGRRIVFTGPVSNDELSIIYALSKIFCFPSYAEGMGLSPLEAMASGIPVIVSNTTSMPEVCGKAALYADPSSPKEIAQKINQLLEDKILYEEKIQEGLKWSENYTWRKTATGIMRSIFTATGKTALY
jgi:glycosyltransferase involved in cell wall biosynthesis